MLLAMAWDSAALDFKLRTAPDRSSSVVTIPGERLWMPTLLTPPIFSSACSNTFASHGAATDMQSVESAAGPASKRTCKDFAS